MKKSKFSVLHAVLLVLLAAFTLSLFFLLYWTLVTALKNPMMFNRKAYMEENLGWLLGFKDLSFENVSYAWQNFTVTVRTTGAEVGIVGMFGNSVLYSIGSAFFATIIPCIVAYLCARYRYRFGSVVYTVVLIAMALPIVGSLPSEITMVKNLGLMDSIFGLWLLKCNFLGLYFLVFYATFKGIAFEYTEAASIDGASEFRIMVTIIFPLAIGTIFTVFILKFIEFWNDYQIPMIYWNSHPVAAYGMFEFNRSTVGMNGRVPVKMAGMLIMTLPILVVYGIFNGKLTANVTVGGVKG